LPEFKEDNLKKGDNPWIVLTVNTVNLWSLKVFYAAKMGDLATGRRITDLKRW